MPIPDLTHQQFIVLEQILQKGKISGRDLRAGIAGEGMKKTGPAFYQFMARMEDARWVKGWYEQKIVEGQIIKERWYQVIGKGAEAYNETRAFYLNRGGTGEGVVAHG